MKIEEIRKLNINKLADKYGRNILSGKLGYQDNNYLNQLCSGFGSFGSRTARKIEKKLSLPDGWMDVSHQKNDTTIMRVEVADESNSLPIKYIAAKGSCGGGSPVFEEKLKHPLKKEYSFFSHYNVKHSDVLAVKADGDSMADFIIDDDIVLFNVAKKEPKNKTIFLLRTRNGLRIKELLETSSGKWKIRSRNPEHKDEEIVDADQIEIIGEYFFRQG